MITTSLDKMYRIFGEWLYGDPGDPNPAHKISEKMILTYGQFARNAIKSHTQWILKGTYIIDGNFTTGSMLIKFPFFGSVMTALKMEELIELGVKEFVIAGWAGAIQPDLHVGDIIVCDRAVRDEGVSHHYLKPAKYVSADKTLVKELSTYAKKLGIPAKVGTTWTTDAPFRETAEEVKAYSRKGILTVEMEAATVFSLAKYYDIKAAAVFVISDSLARLRWKPATGLPFEKVPTALHLASRGKFIPKEDETPLDKKILRRLEDAL
jgi:uridine phosphorylase